MNTKEQRMQRITNDILDVEDDFIRYKKRMPLGFLVGIAMGFVLPFIPLGLGNESLSERMEYHYAVLISIGGLIVIFIGAYIDQKNRSEKKIRDLRLKRYLLERED
jgi:uncharacterized membrane protein YfcA